MSYMYTFTVVEILGMFRRSFPNIYSRKIDASPRMPTIFDLMWDSV